MCFIIQYVSESSHMMMLQDEGVKVFVLLYKEVEVALGINSSYSKISLTQKNPENIKVLL